MKRTVLTDGALLGDLLQRGVSRRGFLKFSATMAATLALPAVYGTRIANAVASSACPACGGAALVPRTPEEIEIIWGDGPCA